MKRNNTKEIVFSYSRIANKFFAKHQDIKQKFISNIERFINGEKIDIKEIAGYKNVYRNRIGKYRVIYTIINERITIVNVISAGSRGDIYKHMGK